MRKKLLLALAVAASLSVGAQNVVRGTVKLAGTNEPASGAVVTLQGQQVSTVTDALGRFEIEAVAVGDEVITIALDSYDVEARPITISGFESLDLGVMSLSSSKEEVWQELTEEAFLAISDIEFDDEDGLSSQSISGLLYSKGDVFTSAASFGFSAGRYRVRGYDSRYESTYINGVNFNDGERGRFNFSSIGGLNYAMRNKEVINNFAPNAYTYGNLGNTTNIDVRASKYARGGNVSLSGTNRSYWLRAQATYASGLMSNGWAVAVSGSYRWAQEGRTEGTFYNAGGIFLSAQKVFNDHHSLNIAAYCTPTERAGSSALTQETVDLTSDYYSSNPIGYSATSYNPYWGWYNGKKRNSRIVHSYDPTLLLNYDWKIAEDQTLAVGLGAHYSMYSNSALTFYNAPDPRPDYYRNLPSYQLSGWGLANDGNFYHDYDYRVSGGSADWQGGDQSLIKSNVSAYNELTNIWTNGHNKGNTQTQLDWDGMYAANYANNIVNPNGMAKYMIERRHNNLLEAALNATYENKSFEHLNIVAGVEGKYTMGRHYKTVDDLMGANQWYDIDPFSDRDINDLAEDVEMSAADVAYVRINDLSNLEDGKAKKVGKGDRFGYDYDINVTRVSAFAQNTWDFTHVEFYYGLKLSYTDFFRNGHMENGRAWYLSKQLGTEVLSKGVGAKHNFYDPSLKAGVVYKINGHHRIFANVLAETRAPLPSNFYIAQRNHDLSIDTYWDKAHDAILAAGKNGNLVSQEVYMNQFYKTASNSLLKAYSLTEKVLSADLNYVVTYPRFRARLSGYYTASLDGIESNGYYNDEYRTFINHLMFDVDKMYAGLEFGASVKLNSMFTLSGVLAYNEAHYTSNPIGVESAENGMKIDGEQEIIDRIMLTERGIDGKAVKVANGPQLAAMLKLNFFHDKLWFADLSVSYLDRNYLGVAPSRYSQGMLTGKRVDGSSAKTWYGANCTADEAAAKANALATQESLFDGCKWYNHILVDASVGKLIYLPNNRSININVSLSNLTNNTGLKTGGWQQARIPTTVYRQTTYKVSNYVDKYPSKYYYAWGFNFFLNVGFKF